MTVGRNNQPVQPQSAINSLSEGQVISSRTPDPSRYPVLAYGTPIQTVKFLSLQISEFSGSEENMEF